MHSSSRAPGPRLPGLQTSGHWAPGTWLTAPQAAAALNVSISTLYRWRTHGLLVAGQDWMRKWPSPKSPVLYHLERVEQRMAQKTSTDLSNIEPVLG